MISGIADMSDAEYVGWDARLRIRENIISYKELEEDDVGDDEHEGWDHASRDRIQSARSSSGRGRSRGGTSGDGDDELSRLKPDADTVFTARRHKLRQLQQHQTQRPHGQPKRTKSRTMDVRPPPSRRPASFKKRKRYCTQLARRAKPVKPSSRGSVSSPITRQHLWGDNDSPDIHQILNMLKNLENDSNIPNKHRGVVRDQTPVSGEARTCAKGARVSVSITWAYSGGRSLLGDKSGVGFPVKDEKAASELVLAPISTLAPAVQVP